MKIMWRVLALALFSLSSFGAQNSQKISASAPLTLTSGVMAIPRASGSVNGYLGLSDWTTFNSKQSTLTFGNLTSSTTGLSLTGGTGAVIGAGVAINIQTASGSQPGLLDAADWTIFNGKQASGNYITGLTGDVTASGPGSVAASIASATVTGKVLTGFVSGAGAVSATDTILQAFDKVVGNIALLAPLASPTFTGVVGLPSATLSGYLKSGNYHMEPVENNAGNSSTAQTIDWSTGSAQLSTLTGSVTYTFSNPVTGGAYVLRIATGAGSFTATWPASVKWSGGTAPTITATASKVDLINFYYDGTNYYGSFTQNY